MGIRWPAWLGGREAEAEEGARPRPARMFPVEGFPALEALLSTGSTTSVVLYLHDPWCPVSSRAIEEVERVDADVHVIDVSRQRELSRAIAEATGIRHESPQVIVLKDGRPTWHASHWRIRAGAVEGAMGRQDAL
ncbi:MAG: bacillithiol system redox-active protein YtxJ [Dehalococcoidia bacterium]